MYKHGFCVWCQNQAVTWSTVVGLCREQDNIHLNSSSKNVIHSGPPLVIAAVNHIVYVSAATNAAKCVILNHHFTMTLNTDRPSVWRLFSLSLTIINKWRQSSRKTIFRFSWLTKPNQKSVLTAEPKCQQLPVNNENLHRKKSEILPPRVVS